jgi:nucleoid DNA-binding protein
MREYLIRMLAPKLLLSEKVIDQVIVHQFNEANKALASNYSLEISGFGKFLFNHKKAVKRMETLLSKERMFKSILERDDISEQKRESTINKLNNNTIAIEQLKPRINETVRDLRGLEEQAPTS